MGPLTCWDIVTEGLNRKLNLRNDIEALEKISSVNQWNFNEASWRNSLIWEDKVVIITDPSLKILHATENIYDMNGYSLHELIGKRPKMFQGKETESIELEKINNAILKRKSFVANVTNYKKNGDLYKCRIEAYPVFNQEQTLVNFMAIENIVH